MIDILSFEPFYRPLNGVENVFTFFNVEFLDPWKGLEGFLCPEIDIFSNVSNIGRLFGATDKLLCAEYKIDPNRLQ